MVEQGQRGGGIVGLPRAQYAPDPQALPADERVNLGCDATPKANETMTLMLSAKRSMSMKNELTMTRRRLRHRYG